MAYISEWLRLREALDMIVEAGGLSKNEVRSDICRAIADGAIRFRAQLRRHTSKGLTSNQLLEGANFELRKVKSDDFDWESSRPLKPWFVRREQSKVPGLWELARIELSRSDVMNVLCLAKSASCKAPVHVPTKTAPASRSRPARERAERALSALYPERIPDQVSVPNATLCRQVGEKLKMDGLPDVKDDTILRAAGRRN